MIIFYILLWKDIDECKLLSNPCFGGTCHNTDGSYRCSCPSGFELKGSSTCVGTCFIYLLLSMKLQVFYSQDDFHLKI